MENAQAYILYMLDAQPIVQIESWLEPLWPVRITYDIITNICYYLIIPGEFLINKLCSVYKTVYFSHVTMLTKVNIKQTVFSYTTQNGEEWLRNTFIWIGLGFVSQ